MSEPDRSSRRIPPTAGVNPPSEGGSSRGGGSSRDRDIGNEGAVAIPMPAGGLAITGRETVINPERRAGGGSQGTPTLVRADGSAVVVPLSDEARALFPGADVAEGDVRNLAAEPLSLGHYDVVGRIRTGGMGAVFRAVDRQLGRVVALKVLPPALARDPQAVMRFRHEARSTALLNHDHVARVYFSGEQAGLHYIAFEFVEGTNIRELLASGQPLSVAQAVRVTYQIATALKHMADRGVVHRDIKPSNIILSPDGDATLVDFGLARAATRTESEADLTVAGTTLGTFDYIAPEQARDPRTANVQSDIYSLGCSLYHMLTGQPPYPEGTVLQKLLQHQGDEAPDPARKNRRVPAALSAIVRAMMAKDVRKRYPGPEPLLRDLAVVAAAIGLRLGAAGEIALPADRSRPMQRFLGRHGVWLTAACSFLALVLAVEYGPKWVRSSAFQQGTNSSERPSGRNDLPISASPGAGRSGGAPGADAGADQPSPRPGAGTAVAEKPSRPAESQGTGIAEIVGSVLDRLAGRTRPGDVTRMPGDGTATTTDENGGPAVSATGPRAPARESGGTSPSQPIVPTPLVAGNDPRTAGASATGRTAESAVAEIGLRPAAVDADMRLGPMPIGAELALVVGREELAPRTGNAGSRVPAAPRASSPVSAAEDEAGYLVAARDGGDPRRFNSLEAACEAVADGGVVEVRFNGVRRESPIKVRRRLTLRAARGYRPIIEFQPIQLPGEGWQARMVTVAGGSLEVVGLELRFTARPETLSGGGALISLERGDSIRISESTLTLVDGDRQFVAAIEVDPGSARAMPDMEMSRSMRSSPTIELDHCLIRGEGAGLVLRGGDPVTCTVRHTVAALSGVFVRVGIATDLVTEGLRTEIRCEHLSAALGDGFAQVVTSLSTRRPVPVQFRVVHCLLANEGTAALLGSTGPLPRSDQQTLVAWSGQRNVYRGFNTFWAVGTDDPIAMPDLIDFAAWQSRWGDAGETDVESGPIDWRLRWGDVRPAEVTPAEFSLSGTAETNHAIGGATDGRNLGADVPALLQLGLGRRQTDDES